MGKGFKEAALKCRVEALFKELQQETNIKEMYVKESMELRQEIRRCHALLDRYPNAPDNDADLPMDLSVRIALTFIYIERNRRND